MQKLYVVIVLSVLFSVLNTNARKKSNVFSSTVSEVDLRVNGQTPAQIIRSTREVLKGREKWLDAFLKQNPGRLNGVFTFDNKINVVAIAYSTNNSTARSNADKLCINTMEENDIEQVGVYSKHLKVSTRNGYFVYAILRSPVSSGFRSMDFNTGSSEVDDLFK